MKSKFTPDSAKALRSHAPLQRTCGEGSPPCTRDCFSPNTASVFKSQNACGKLKVWKQKGGQYQKYQHRQQHATTINEFVFVKSSPLYEECTVNQCIKLILYL